MGSLTGTVGSGGIDAGADVVGPDRDPVGIDAVDDGSGMEALTVPLYCYRCPGCGKTSRRICSPLESRTRPRCCGQDSERVPGSVSSRTVEVLDNGVMTKSIERLTDAERLFRERHDAVEKERKGGN